MKLFRTCNSLVLIGGSNFAAWCIQKCMNMAIRVNSGLSSSAIVY